MKDRNHDEAMAELLREDPAYAVQLLNSILEDGDQRELLITLRQMAKAFGGVQTVAETAHLSRAVESWLHHQVGPAYDALKADPARAVTVDQVRARLASEHAKER